MGYVGAIAPVFSGVSDLLNDFGKTLSSFFDTSITYPFIPSKMFTLTNGSNGFPPIEASM